MNKAQQFINYKSGGNNYILRATSHNKWVGFQESVIKQLKSTFGVNFFIVVWSDKNIENDFYKIPFFKLEHLFTEEHKTSGNLSKRWTATIVNHQFLMHSNRKYSVDISSDYGNIHSGDISLHNQIIEDLSSQDVENEYFEGSQKHRFSSYYERNSKIRLEAIKIHGFTCSICGFNFKQVYGVFGSDFIEVHHLKPVSTLGSSVLVNPKTDMTVVCSNCHRMLHRKKDSVLTPEELRKILAANE